MKVIIFGDHEIGARILQKILLSAKIRKIFTLSAIFTTEKNGYSWWPRISDLTNKPDCPFYTYPKNIDKIKSFSDVDLFILLSWKYIIPDELIQIPKIGVINLHYSLLPKYRGVYPVNWAIINGEKFTGVTFHWVNNVIDGGSIIVQKKIKIEDYDNARSLQLKLDNLAYSLFDKVIEFVLRKNNKKNVKNNVKKTHELGEYYSKQKFLETNKIDLDKKYTARDFINFLRGKSFFPHSKNAFFFNKKGEKIFLTLLLNTEDGK